jgi:hypothetical protein
MRAALVVTLFALCLGAPAASAAVDPSHLVLRGADVPSGFRLDSSGVLTNASESAREPGLAALYRSWGRVTGYRAAFRTGDGSRGPSIESRSDVFRRAAGAHRYFVAFDREMRLAGIKGLTRTAAPIGDEGLVFSGAAVGSAYTLVFWREGRAVGAVIGIDVPRARTVALARRQQLRMDGALG